MPGRAPPPVARPPWPASRRSSGWSPSPSTSGRCCPARRSATGARCRPSRTSSASPIPTGYPTYILLAWLAQLVPIGIDRVPGQPPVGRARGGALATVTVAILLRLGRPAGDRGRGGAGARAPWARSGPRRRSPRSTRSTCCSSRSLLHRALVWEERRRPRDLVLGALLLGLAAGNHLLTLFVAPFVVLFVAVGRTAEIAARPWMLGGGRRGRAPRRWASTSTSRSRRPGTRRSRTTTPSTLDAVLWLVSGAQFRGQFAFLSVRRAIGEFVGSLRMLWAGRSRAGRRPSLPVLGVVGPGRCSSGGARRSA